MAHTKQSTLMRFFKDQCANFENHYQECLFLKGGGCKVLDGKRCGYFERVVLCVPQKSRLPDYDYVKLHAQYADLTKAPHREVEQRRCECGAPLAYRRRFCSDCAGKRAKTAARERQRNQRLSKSVVVTV